MYYLFTKLFIRFKEEKVLTLKCTLRVVVFKLFIMISIKKDPP